MKSTLERPILAVDLVVFRMSNRTLEVLIHKRQSEPFQDAPALPGAAVRIEESLKDAAYRTLEEKVGINPAISENLFLDQLATFDALYRDPRGRTVSVAYMGLIRDGDNMTSNSIIWVSVTDLLRRSLPFDHNQIIKAAVDRLKGKLKYTNIAGGFLPDLFRIEALQEIYEAVLNRPLNRTNFRNKLLKINMIEQVSTLNEAVGQKGGRPPHLYRFTRDLIEAVDRDFL